MASEDVENLLPGSRAADDLEISAFTQSITEKVWYRSKTLVWGLGTVLGRDGDEEEAEDDEEGGEEDKDGHGDKAKVAAASDSVAVLRVRADFADGAIERGEVFDVDEGETLPYNETHSLTMLDDVTRMDDLNEACLLDLLRRRFLKKMIYTFAGDTLVSINPYQIIDGLYEVEKFTNNAVVKTEGDGENREADAVPHVYSIADSAYEAMRHQFSLTSSSKLTNQSILVNGESGAGKTEACKHIMRRLAFISAMQRKGSERAEETTSSDGAALAEETSQGAVVERCVLQSNVLLEAFGNAKTIRNDNSSRFGKFIQLFYDQIGSMCGASTKHFLLEKSRLVKRSAGERNYHVLYQLCRGLGAAADHVPEEYAEEVKVLSELLELHNKASDYRYLQGSTGDAAPSDEEISGDVREFFQLIRAFDAMGVTREERVNLFKTLAAILKIGNIDFVKKDDAVKMQKEADKDEAVVADDAVAEKAARMLDVSPALLRKNLCERMFSARRGSTIALPLTPEEAAECRDGLAKTLYSATFDWIVKRINAATAAAAFEEADKGDATAAGFVGILDIFGFEILENNSFEQLCINFANEMLQRIYNHHIFEVEQEYYESEGIDWSRLSFSDNTPLLNLLTLKKTGKPAGIFLLLDEQGLLGDQATDQAFLAKVTKTHIEHDNFQKPRLASHKAFEIKHYAGTVRYNCTGFIKKNNDSLTAELLSFAGSSKVDFIRDLVTLKKPVDEGSNEDEAGGRSRKRKKMLGAMTVSTKFRGQMNKLCSTLEETAPHFVRCVKPNSSKLFVADDSSTANGDGAWEPTLILNQLRYLGVMETVRIRREGYPVRRAHEALFMKYRLLLPSKLRSSKDFQAGCREILSLVLGSSDGDGDKDSAASAATWQIGSKKVFLRDGQLAKLDAALRRLFYDSARKMQSWHRGRKGREIAFERKKFVSARKLQSLMRRKIAKRELEKKVEAKDAAAATVLQAKARAYLRSKQFKRQLEAIHKINAAAKGKIERERYAKTKEAALKLEAAARGMKERREVKKMKKAWTAAATRVQSKARAFFASKSFARQLHAINKINNVVKGKIERETYAKKKNAALKLHATARGFIRRREVRNMRKVWNNAAGRVQSTFRGVIERRHYKKKRNAAIKIEAAARAMIEKKNLKGTRAAAVHLQAWGRQHIVRAAYLEIMKNKAEWSRFLMPNEAIVLTSVVRKKTTAAYTAGLLSLVKRRQLILTTKRRLLYIKPKDMSLKGNIMVDKIKVQSLRDTKLKEEEEAKGRGFFGFGGEGAMSEAAKEAAKKAKKAMEDDEGEDMGAVRESKGTLLALHSEFDFKVHTVVVHDDGGSGGYERVYDFKDLLGPAQRWADAVQFGATTVMELIHKGASKAHFAVSSQKQGYLMKRAMKSQTNWRSRYFVLHGADLLWFKKTKSKAPQGQVKLTSDAIVSNGIADGKTSGANAVDRTCFTVITSNMPIGASLVARCESREQAEDWIKAIRKAVKEIAMREEAERKDRMAKTFSFGSMRSTGDTSVANEASDKEAITAAVAKTQKAVSHPRTDSLASVDLHRESAV